MEGITSINEAKILFGDSFFGKERIMAFFKSIGTSVQDFEIPHIPYNINFLKSLKNDYILIYGYSCTIDEKPINIEYFRNFFGINPSINEPCFYNQDWYLHEDFYKTTLMNKWYLLRKEVIDNTRAITPEMILNKNQIIFPSAILMTYTFFVFYILNNTKLWEYDFIWSSDKDHNGDRIYVGKYTDLAGVNKNGFSIHRHLSIRDFYGAVELI